jgi:Zc3h12a-like ribonuclease protein/S1 RNA binding family protein
MQADMKLRHVVVDGSNIATEGHETPSLAQLDQAVQAFIREFEPELVTVVVDATFPNRINRKERKVYEEAVTAGEVITPPAGAIGRGDAFVLQIADRAGAAVLSNDSFQEFHGDYPWLFDQGRLIGGKPVPHVGWVFMGRAPVRGPTSRRATSVAKRGKAKEVARPEGTAPAAAPTEAPAKRRRVARKADGAEKAAKTDGAEKAAKAARPAPAEPPTEAPAKRRRGARKADGADKADQTDKAKAERTAAAQAPSDETPSPPQPAAAVADIPDTTATPAYNEPGPYGDFLSKHPVGSDVQAVVESFGSHGAYLRCGKVRAYAPLKNLADPAPRSAKEVVKAGETRTFVVAEIDRARRGVDMALPGTDAARTAAASRPAEPESPSRAKAAKATRAGKSARPAKAAKSTKGSEGQGTATRSGKAPKDSGGDGPAKKAKATKKAAKAAARSSKAPKKGTAGNRPPSDPTP